MLVEKRFQFSQHGFGVFRMSEIGKRGVAFFEHGIDLVMLLRERVEGGREVGVLAPDVGKNVRVFHHMVSMKRLSVALFPFAAQELGTRRVTGLDLFNGAHESRDVTTKRVM